MSAIGQFDQIIYGVPMAIRSIASLSLTFGLVSIPVKVYSATESSAALRFKWLSSSGARIRQQYVAETPAPAVSARPASDDALGASKASQASVRVAAAKIVEFSTPRRQSAALVTATDVPALVEDQPVIERSDMVKGYEYEKGKFVLFTPGELKALESASRTTIDIMSFIPRDKVDPIFYDKAYFLTPDKRASKPYSLLLRAMRETERCALAKWAFRSKEYVVQIRPEEGGLILQQLLYADEIRSIRDLSIELADVGDTELALAKQLIAQISADSYDPAEFADEEKKRILDAVQRKIAGQGMVAAPAKGPRGQVVDLLSALRASLKGTGTEIPEPEARKPARRAPGKRARTATNSPKASSNKR